MAALRRFPLEKGRDITIEYVLLAGYNDSPQDAVALAKLIRGLHAKVNAIPFNEDANLPAWMKRPSRSRDRPLRRHARAQRRARDGAALEGPRHRRGVRPVARQGNGEEPRATVPDALCVQHRNPHPKRTRGVELRLDRRARPRRPRSPSRQPSRKNPTSG